MKVGFITHWYDPEGGAAAGPGTIARAIRERGHDVEVLTGFPIYPSGRVAPGYRISPYKRESMDGITIHRTAIYPSHDRSATRRMANYLSYAATGALVAPAVLRSCDVLFVYSTPATAAIPALPIRALWKTPMVVQIQDLWPQTVTASGFVEGGRAGRMERAIHLYCDLVYQLAHTIAVTSPGMAELIHSRGIGEGKIKLLPNWAEERSFYPTERDPQIAAQLGLDERFTVMYAGNFGEMQNLETVLDAARHLRDLGNCQIVLVGGGVARERLAQRVSKEKIDNVRLIDPVPFSLIANVLALADVQLVSLKDTPLYRATLPSKLQANLAVGRPVIGAVAGDAADVIRRSGAGIVTRPGDAGELANAIRYLYDLAPAERLRMGSNGRRYYETNFSETAIGDRLCELLATAAVDAR